MSVIVLLIIASLAIALFFLGGFLWAVKSGQYEDTGTPSMRVLLDEQDLINNPRKAGDSTPPTPAARKPQQHWNK
jgi:cbb3-type cytochrome oxidase maturation protein